MANPTMAPTAPPAPSSALAPEPKSAIGRDRSPTPLAEGAFARRSRQRLAGLQLSERRILLMLGDLGMMSLALLAALWLRLPGLSEAYGTSARLFVLKLHWWLVLWGVWMLVSITADCYDLQRASSGRGAIQAAACALATSALYFVVPFLSAPLTSSRLTWFLFALLATLGVVAWRVGYATLGSQPTFTRRALIVGAGCSGCALAETIRRIAGASGVELVGFVDDNPALQEQEIAGRPVLGTSQDLEALAEQLEVDQIVVAIADPHRIGPDLQQALVRCWKRGLSTLPMSLCFEDLTGSIPVEHIGQNLFALVDQQDKALRRAWCAVRRVVDVVAGAVGLLVLAPLVPLIGLAIWLDGPGPIFYRQQRVGRGGRTFWLTKFRSMVPDAESQGAQWARAHDERVTRVGRFLRKTRLDELPQLWNVLVGDMSLIGPRPERPEFVQQLESQLPYYAIRHAIKPGLTGWAQVRYRYGNSVEDARIKLQYDLHYVKCRGPVLDLLILLHTLRVVLRMQGT
jgi:exopolysaccharide biosynthesis polyprenyl glycosylphosphotransferase